MPHRRTTLAIASALLIAACGGSAEQADAPATITSPTTLVASDPEPTATTSNTEPPGTSPATTPQSTVDSPTSADEPWRVESTAPSGPTLDGWADLVPIEPKPGDPPAGIDAQLVWIYRALIELWSADLRLNAIPFGETAMSLTHREAAPAAMIDVVGAASSVLGDSYATIHAYAEAAATTDIDSAEFFTPWVEFAAGWTAVADAIRASLLGIRNAPRSDQVCYLARIDGDDDCDGPGYRAGQALSAELEVLFDQIDAVDIDEPSAAQAYGFDFDSCAAWDAAAAAVGLTPDGETRIWLAIDDNYLDTLFVDLSECGYEENGVEDAVADDDADTTLLLEYLTAVADAAVAGGYTEDVYDLGSGTEAERDEYERRSANATEWILDEARETASQLWWRVGDTTLAGKLYIVANISIDAWFELRGRELDWDDVGNRVCDGWTTVLDRYSGEELSSITASADELGLDGTLIPEGCD